MQRFTRDTHRDGVAPVPAVATVAMMEFAAVVWGPAGREAVPPAGARRGVGVVGGRRCGCWSWGCGRAIAPHGWCRMLHFGRVLNWCVSIPLRGDTNMSRALHIPANSRLPPPSCGFACVWSGVGICVHVFMYYIHDV